MSHDTNNCITQSYHQKLCGLMNRVVGDGKLTKLMTETQTYSVYTHE